MRRKYQKSYTQRFLLVLCYAVGVAISTSKTAIVGLVAGFFYLIWTSRKTLKISGTRVFQATGGFIAVLLCVFCLNGDSRLRISHLFASQESVTSNFGSRVYQSLITGLQGREGVYRRAVELIKKRPVQGYGVFQTANAFTSIQYVPLIHPHNIVLLQLIEGGVVALICFLVLFLVPHFSSQRDPKGLRLIVGLQA
jgi:O-antigen ligase